VFNKFIWFPDYITEHKTDHILL